MIGTHLPATFTAVTPLPSLSEWARDPLSFLPPFPLDADVRPGSGGTSGRFVIGSLPPAVLASDLEGVTADLARSRRVYRRDGVRVSAYSIGDDIAENLETAAVHLTFALAEDDRLAEHARALADADDTRARADRLALQAAIRRGATADGTGDPELNAAAAAADAAAHAAADYAATLSDAFPHDPASGWPLDAARLAEVADLLTGTAFAIRSLSTVRSQAVVRAAEALPTADPAEVAVAACLDVLPAGRYPRPELHRLAMSETGLSLGSRSFYALASQHPRVRGPRKSGGSFVFDVG